MIKLPDEKLIDKILKDIDEDDWMLVDIRWEQLTKDTLKNILQKHLTHPTDEVREEHPCYKCWNLCNDFCGKCWQDQEVILEKEVEGIEKEEPIPQCICPDSRCYHWWWPKEVKPPTKDTIEKIERIELTKDDDYWEDTHKKINELIDKYNHQQEQIKQLLSDK